MINQMPKQLQRVTILASLVLCLGVTSLAKDGDSYPPTQADSTKLEYSFGTSGIAIYPGEEIRLQVPKSFNQKAIDFVFITHKQRPEQFSSHCHQSKQNEDCTPGYTSFEVLPANTDQLPKAWRCWGGPGSGPCNSKFAEIRDGEGETDNLYEWYKHGHIDSSNSRDNSHAPLMPAELRVRAFGQDHIWLQKVVVKFSPAAPSKVIDYKFSRDLEFGDPITAHGRRYPRRGYLGDYGNALLLSSRGGYSHTQYPEVVIDNGEIVVEVPKRGRLSFVDIACGDMKPVPPGADPEAYRGNSKLSVSVESSDGRLYEIMPHENVGANGVMRALIPKELPLANIRKVHISVAKSKSSIMGIRLGMD